MALSALSANTITAPDAGTGRGSLGTPKTLRSRGTYESLGSVQDKIQQGQTGQGLRESYAAQRQGSTAAPAQARSNTLIAQAGLPSGLNKTLPQSTADVLAVRVERQNFMHPVAS